MQANIRQELFYLLFSVAVTVLTGLFFFLLILYVPITIIETTASVNIKLNDLLSISVKFKTVDFFGLFMV